jgi:hypothetical protein
MVCPEIPLDCSYREILVSTDELAAQQLPDVFPIPANQWLQWNNASGITNAELINAQGQRVAVATCNGANAMDVSGLANGVYILRLHSDQRVYQRSIMIAH